MSSLGFLSKQFGIIKFVKMTMWWIVKSLQDANTITKFRRAGKIIPDQLHCGKRCSWFHEFWISRKFVIMDWELEIRETTWWAAQKKLIWTVLGRRVFFFVSFLVALSKHTWVNKMGRSYLTYQIDLIENNH